MLTDAAPTGYTYDDAAVVLSHLGFQLAPHGGGSHRMWRLRTSSGNLVVIGLVDHGAGTMKAYLIRDMVAALRMHGLIPPELNP
jgi:hypothetical protein